MRVNRTFKSIGLSALAVVATGAVVLASQTPQGSSAKSRDTTTEVKTTTAAASPEPTAQTVVTVDGKSVPVKSNGTTEVNNGSSTTTVTNTESGSGSTTTQTTKSTGNGSVNITTYSQSNNGQGASQSSNFVHSSGFTSITSNSNVSSGGDPFGL